MSEFLQNEQDYLERYKSLVEEKLNWGNSADWRHYDFESLSEKIFEETGVMLSSTTLKRIWGKLKYDSTPNTQTLNALASFIGYKSWIEFRTKVATDQDHKVETTPHTKTKRRNSFKNAPLKWAAIMLFLTGFVLLGLGLQKGNRTFSSAELSKITFTSTPVSKGIPNTVIFKYDVSNIKTSEVAIQQSWDERLQFDIDANRHEATSTYYYPGYFRAKLLVDEVITKEHDLYIQSDGWISTLNRQPQPRYFLPNELKETKVLGISDQVMAAEHAKDAEELSVLGFHYVDNFGELPSDNFSLEASFKNTHYKGNGICQLTKVVVLCTEGAFIIPFSIPGCVGDLRLIFNDVLQSGKDNDLSSFGCDFSDWQDFKLEIQNRAASIYLNDRVIHNLSYQYDAGRVVGFRFLFTGNGELDDVRLQGPDGEIVFEENFENSNQ